MVTGFVLWVSEMMVWNKQMLNHLPDNLLITELWPRNRMSCSDVISRRWSICGFFISKVLFKSFWNLRRTSRYKWPSQLNWPKAWAALYYIVSQHGFMVANVINLTEVGLNEKWANVTVRVKGGVCGYTLFKEVIWKLHLWLGIVIIFREFRLYFKQISTEHRYKL